MSSVSFLGIDVAKDSFALCIAVPAADPRKWPVHQIEYKDPLWHEHLAAHLTPDSVVVAEPAGHALIAPLAAALRRAGCDLWLIDNAATGDIRRQHLSRAKTDDLDTRALAIVATWINTAYQPISARRFTWAAETLAQNIRLYINTHRRHLKDNTRALNQIEALAHSIWPQLARQRPTWLTAVALGAIDPAEIHTLVERGQIPGKNRPHIEKLAAAIPADVRADEPTKAAVLDLVNALDQRRSRIDHIESHVRMLLINPQIAETTELWRTVPFSSDMTIAALHVATRCQIHNFSPQAFRSAVAVAPKTIASAGTDSTTLARAGYKPAGAGLYTWTMLLVAERAPENPVRAAYRRGTGNRPFFAARAKLATILHAIAISRQPCRW